MLQCHVRACPKWWSTTSAFASDGTAYLPFSPDDNIVFLHMHLQERQRTNCQHYFKFNHLLNGHTSYLWEHTRAPLVSFQQLIKDWTSLLRHRNVFGNISGNCEVCMCSPPPHTPQMKFMRPASSWHFVQLYDADVWNVGLPITEQ